MLLFARKAAVSRSASPTCNGGSSLQRCRCVATSADCWAIELESCRMAASLREAPPNRLRGRVGRRTTDRDGHNSRNCDSATNYSRSRDQLFLLKLQCIAKLMFGEYAVIFVQYRWLTPKLSTGSGACIAPSTRRGRIGRRRRPIVLVWGDAVEPVERSPAVRARGSFGVCRETAARLHLWLCDCDLVSGGQLYCALRSQRLYLTR
jgi:hypothetical protein